MKREGSGFTLIELLVVIAIIAILAAILFPVFMSAKDAAKKAKCVSNMREINYAYKMYLGDWGDRYPTNDFGAHLWLLDKYMKEKRFKTDEHKDGVFTQTVWVCPAVATISRDDFSGAYYTLIDQDAYWESCGGAPWKEAGLGLSKIWIYNSYVVNDDVTSSRSAPGPFHQAIASRVTQPSQIVFLGEGCWNPTRLFPRGTCPTATHPWDKAPGGAKIGEEVTSGWYPGYPNVTSKSDLQNWHGAGSNFMYVDGHVAFSTSVPSYDHWRVPN